MNLLDGRRLFSQLTAFHLPKPPFLQTPCRTRKFKISLENFIFILVGGRRRAIYFSPLSGFNYDQTFQSDEISWSPKPTWSFKSQLGRTAAHGSLGLNHPPHISEHLAHQRRSRAVFQLIGSWCNILNHIQQHIPWGFLNPI